MVLLASSAQRNTECATAIRRLTGEQVRCARDLREAINELRREQFSVMAVDQQLWDMEPALAHVAIQSCGTAALVLISPAISGVQRVVHEISAALRRRESELRRARENAEATLRTELNEAVTGILLSSELALGSPGLPATAVAKIRSVYELAMSIRERLGG